MRNPANQPGVRYCSWRACRSATRISHGHEQLRSARRRTNDPEGLRRRVLDAAATLFQTRGYANTAMHDIAQAAGVTGGECHHHFPTKKSVAIAVVRERVREAVDETWIAPVPAAASVQEGVAQVFQTLQEGPDGSGPRQRLPAQRPDTGTLGGGPGHSRGIAERLHRMARVADHPDRTRPARRAAQAPGRGQARDADRRVLFRRHGDRQGRTASRSAWSLRGRAGGAYARLGVREAAAERFRCAPGRYAVTSRRLSPDNARHHGRPLRALIRPRLKAALGSSTCPTADTALTRTPPGPDHRRLVRHRRGLRPGLCGAGLRPGAGRRGAADRLEALAAELAAAHGIEAFAIPADLAEFEAHAEAPGGGRGARGRMSTCWSTTPASRIAQSFAGVPWERQRDFLMTLVVNACGLAHGVIPGMVERGRRRDRQRRLAGRPSRPAWRATASIRAPRA